MKNVLLNLPITFYGMDKNYKLELPSTFYQMSKDKKLIKALEYLTTTYNTMAGDMLITFDRTLSFLKDQKFLDTLLAHPEPQAQTLAWRLHTACWAAKQALHLPGDFVECGVERAVQATQIINYLDFKNINKNYYLYDTFGGIPDSYLENHDISELNHYNKNASENYTKICERFHDYTNIHITQGALPESLEVICPEKIAFLHIDLCNFPSEYDVLKILLPKIVPGGIVLFQAFGWAAYGCYEIANTELIKETKRQILELPTGQGLLIL